MPMMALRPHWGRERGSIRGEYRCWWCYRDAGHSRFRLVHRGHRISEISLARRKSPGVSVRAGSVPQRSPTGISGHQRSPSVRRNRRSRRKQHGVIRIPGCPSRPG